VGGVDDDPALQLTDDRKLRVRPDQPGRVGDVDGMQGRLEPHLADDGVINATGLDLDLVVAVASRLRCEGKPEDAGPGVEVQVCRRAHAPGQPVFGVDGCPKVGSDGADHHRRRGHDRTDQQPSHPDILAHRAR
jgi:hypothetical protein